MNLHDLDAIVARPGVAAIFAALGTGKRGWWAALFATRFSRSQ
jgi:hypothetical protein